MIKFLFFVSFSLPLIFVNRSFFWLISGLLVVCGSIFISLNLYFVDGIFLGNFYLDVLSFRLIILRIWISILIYISRSGVYFLKNNLFYFSFCVFILCLILILTFSSLNLLSFYFYFEASLVPTLLIIIGWGYQPERLQAGIYFLFYTLTASLPLLLILLSLNFNLGGLDLLTLSSIKFNSYSLYLIIGLTLAFLVKIPIFFVHLWLPKAHVEAPVSGSMILAGVLLKLGGYGFYRVLSFCRGALKFYGGYALGLRIFGMLYVGFICCRLNDIKALVAYSSVAHIALVIRGVFRIYVWGYTGGLAIMVSHGLASSGLFCIVNIYYERRGRRRLFLNRGLIIIFPLIRLFMFMLAAANMAAPPTINLMSEIFLIIRIIKYDTIILLIFPVASYLGAVFTLFLFSYSQHGKVYSSVYSYLISGFREYHVLLLHVLPVNFLILKPEYFLFIIYLSSLYKI